MAATDRPWASLPSDLADTMRPVLPGLSDEIIGAIRTDVPEYARPFEGRFGENVRTGVHFALGRFLDLMEQPDRDPGRARQVYVELGRGEFKEGRSLDALLSAYRIGARIAWRRFVEAGKAAGVDPDVLYVLGEAIFAYIEGLSAESIEGYTAAQSLAAGERASGRRRLVRLLAQDPPAEEPVVRAAAERVGWRLPAQVAALVTSGQDADALSSRLGAGAVAAEVDGELIVFVADPDAPRRQAEIAAALGDRPAAIGPSAGWQDAAASVARARLAHRLLEAGLLNGPLAICADHHTTLLLHTDPRLAGDLASRALAPLGELGPGPREKLSATLRAWLDHQGRLDPVAAELGVHVQTVRYRVNQLRELFGPELEDPERRLALALALRV